MTLKKILPNLEGLDAAITALYTQKEDGKFHLEVEDDDTGPLLRAKEHEVGLRKFAEQRADTLAAELSTAKGKVTELEASLSQDSTALRADHERAVAKLKEGFAGEKSSLESTIKKIFVGDKAAALASSIAIDEGAAELLAERIQRRLVVEMVNGEPVTRVLAADGTASNMSPDDLKAEYLQMPKYASILRASEASGGGASGGSKGGGATGKKLSDLGDEERTKLSRDNPAEFKRLQDEARGED